MLLPLSQNVLDSERYGTRHRAAIGISEQTDAVIVVVSEETGSISLVLRGRIERNLTEEQLRRRILNLIRPPTPRRAVPLLRRTLEGRWGIGTSDELEPTGPADPDARIIGEERTHEPSRLHFRRRRNRGAADGAQPAASAASPSPPTEPVVPAERRT